ncbi:MAG: LamG domain-containing protein [Bacteroidota bacterium]|jgi:hypothetical protein
MAYQFTAASSQSLTAPISTETRITGAITLAAWIKSTGVYNSPVSFLAARSSTATNGRAYTLQLNSAGKIGSNINSTGLAANNFVTEGTTVVGTNARHIAATFSPSTFSRVYLDGAQDAERTSSVPSSIADITGVNLNFGGLFGGSFFFNGTIAEVGIWNSALTQPEIASLADGMTCDKVRPQSLVFYAPLVRDLIDQKGGLTITNNNGATVATHPRVYA